MMGKQHLENLKLKVASQVGVNLSKGYNGNITTRQAGLIGGNMVKELIAKAEQDLTHTYTAGPTIPDWVNPMNQTSLF